MAYDLSGRALYPLSTLLPREEFPLAEYIPQDSLNSVFDGLYYTDAEAYSTDQGYHLNLRLAFEGEFALSPPGLSGITLVAGTAGVGWTSLQLELVIGPEPQAALSNIPLSLRIDRSVLKPMLSRTQVDESKHGVDIALGTVTLTINTDGFQADLGIAASIPLSMIGDTGVLIEAANVRPILSPPDSQIAGLDTSFRGVFIGSARIHLPEGLPELAPSDLMITNCSIGTGGFSGGLTLNYNPIFDPNTLSYSGPGSGTLFGLQFGVRSIAIAFKQNSLEESAIAGSMALPYFDAPLDLTIGLLLDGGFTVALNSTTGLVTLNKPGILTLTLESIRFVLDEGVFSVAIGGEITPEVGDLDWPTFQVKELSIDSQGNVRLEGGWLDLREQYTLSLYGFQLEIAKIGFGSTDDGRRWIGFSGGLKLVDGLTAGASVEGLRVIWDPVTNATALTFTGIAVEFYVPDAVYFKGAVAMTELPGGGVRFDGDITLSLISVGLEVEAQLVIGYDKQNDYPFFAIYLGVELPAGIPLAQTGLGLYGIAGLFALQMEPDKGKRKPDGTLELPDEAWYAIQPAHSWYHREASPGDQPGVTNLRKWRNEKDSLALGAGVTIGTVADNGFTFAGRFLLGIVFPGPILFIEGRANLLKERASLRSEPLFRALTVLDMRAGSFLVGLDAQYKNDDTGALIEIGGGAEAFFDFHNPMTWHLYLGIDEPRERRIRAEIIERIFEANAYFMLDAQRLKTGAWIGYDKDWTFGPLKILLEAWIEGSANLSWKPAYLNSFLWMHGRISAQVFGFGLGLGTDARIDAGVFDPFHVRAELSISVDLPWPLPDAEAQIVLEWGPEPDPPLLPVPLKEVSIDHLKITTSWPLPAGELLLPNADPEFDGFFSGKAPEIPSNITPPPIGVPAVPLDARPRLTFGRPVHDDALIGINPSVVYPDAAPESGWEWIGDPDKNQGPARVRSSLREIALEEWTGTLWQTVAQSNPGGMATLWGSWAPVPQLPSGTPAPDSPGPTANVKLWLWSRSPYDYTRRTSGTWEEWFSATYPNYPCIELPPDREVCCDFDEFPVGPASITPWVFPKHPELVIGWRTPPNPQVVAIDKSKMLCFGYNGEAVINLATKVKLIRLFASAGSSEEIVSYVDLTKDRKGEWPNPYKRDYFAFSVFDHEGSALPAVIVKSWKTPKGLLGGIEAGWRTIIRLSAPVNTVEVTLTAFGGVATLSAFDEKNELVVKTMTGKQDVPEMIRISTAIPRISTIELIAPSYELAIHRVCCIVTRVNQLEAIAKDRRDQVIGRFVPKEGMIEIPGREVSTITLSAGGKPFCLKGVCWVIGLSAAERLYREEMLKHIETETAHWHEEGFVLRPFTNYRLKVTTSVEVRNFPYDARFNTTHQLIQCAYFRTEGPPGLTTLSVPKGHPLDVTTAPNGPSDAPNFESGLEDLTRYVKQTIPRTLPGPVYRAASTGEPPTLPRPVYRGYDVGVQFNEDYVEQMYRIAGRDLGLYLYNANGRPARDSLGRLLSPPNRWGRMPSHELSTSEERWLAQLDSASCHLHVERSAIPKNVTLGSEGQMLDPDTLYEGRLVPLLARDGFDRYSVGATANGTGEILTDGINRWIVFDIGTDSAPSRWIIRESGTPPVRLLEQTSDVSNGASARSDLFPGGTFLIRATNPDLAAEHPDQPENWTDYRASVFVRSSDDDLIGMAVRFTGNSGYLVYLDQQLNHRRVVRIRNDIGTLLAESQESYISNKDYHLSVEVNGNRLRVYIDGTSLFDLTDTDFARGSVALFSGANAGALFTDLRVDDLRAAAPVVYRFAFTTSRFADFRHHLSSFHDETWQATLPDNSSINPAVEWGIALQTAPLPPVTESEARAFNNLVQATLGTVAFQPVVKVEVIRVATANQNCALLVRTGEPIDWSRTQLEVLRAPAEPFRPIAPRDARIVSVGFASNGTPNDEWVTILHLNTISLAGYRIERRTIRSSGSPDLPDKEPIFEANLTTDAAEDPLELALLWRPQLVDLSELTVIPVIAESQPFWSASDGILTQNAFVGRIIKPNLPPAPLRAMIVVGAQMQRNRDEIEWTDYRFSVEIRAIEAGAIGVLFRYVDDNNHYRIELDYLRNRTTLVRRQAGVETTIWTASGSYTFGQFHRLNVVLDGNYIYTTLDGVSLFMLFETGILQGGVGFFTLGGPKASFRNPQVDGIRRRLAEWIVKDFGLMPARSHWYMTDGSLFQDADLLLAATNVPGDIGTVLLTTHSEYSDVCIECDLTVPSSNIAGLVFRWRSPSDHYRIIVDLFSNEIRLVCVAEDQSTTLYRSDHVNSTLSIRVEIIGTRIRVWLDEHSLCDLHDSTHVAGLWGPLAVRGTTAAWHRFSVSHAEPNWEPWFTFSDEPTRESGASVTVLSGKETDPSPATLVGEEKIFAGIIVSEFRPAFPIRGIDLRIVDQYGRTSHMSRFLPDFAFDLQTSIRIARAADGTGFAILAPDSMKNSILEAGQYRLRFTFRRNNTIYDTDTLILSKQGKTTDEIVHFDVPWKTRM